MKAGVYQLNRKEFAESANHIQLLRVKARPANVTPDGERPEQCFPVADWTDQSMTGAHCAAQWILLGKPETTIVKNKFPPGQSGARFDARRDARGIILTRH